MHSADDNLFIFEIFHASLKLEIKKKTKKNKKSQHIFSSSPFISIRLDMAHTAPTLPLITHFHPYCSILNTRHPSSPTNEMPKDETPRSFSLWKRGKAVCMDCEERRRRENEKFKENFSASLIIFFSHKMLFFTRSSIRHIGLNLISC